MDLLNIYEYKGRAKDITNSDIVVVYGNVYGDIKNATDVVIINGDLKGDIINCDNVLGTLADKHIGVAALWNKAKSDVPISRKDVGIKDDDISEPYSCRY